MRHRRCITLTLKTRPGRRLTPSRAWHVKERGSAWVSSIIAGRFRREASSLLGQPGGATKHPMVAMEPLVGSAPSHVRLSLPSVVLERGSRYQENLGTLPNAF
jgi:hypothetical protein